MSKPVFGNLLDEELNPTRDAIHVPIIPVYAGEDIMPGRKLRLYKVDGKMMAQQWVYSGATGRPIATVDPWINDLIPKWSLFYAWIRPETIQELWHEWRHRSFDD